MPVRSPEKELAWRERLHEQAASGLSVREFCELRRVSQASFYYWQSELRRREAQLQQSRSSAVVEARRDLKRGSAKNPAKNSVGSLARARSRSEDGATGDTSRLQTDSLFVPVRVLGHSPTAPIELLHPRGYLLRLPPMFDAACLQRVLELLDEAEG